MARKKTHEEFVAEVKELVDDEYEVLGQYINSKNKILIKHVKCSFEYEVKPTNFLNGKRCPKCHGIKKKTHEEFLQEVEKLVGNEFSILGNYTDAKTKIEIKHNKCGYKWEIKPNNFLSGKRCPKCAGNIKKNTEQFKQNVFELEGDNYRVLSNYLSNEDKIRMLHVICGYKYDTTPSSFTSKGSRCPKCANNQMKSTLDFKQEVFELEGDNYKVLGEYVNRITKILMKHVICGFEWELEPRSFITNGTRCPKCNESKGEQTIRQWLNSCEFNYKSQFKFRDCKDEKELPFDFAVFNNKNELILLIEYDGEQHYKPMRYSKDKEKMIMKFKQTQFHDQIKNEYCKNNGIPLLRIPYRNFDNIEMILEKELSNLIID